MSAQPSFAPTSLAELLARQDGVIARWQALATGMSPEGWEWRLRAARWQRPVPGVAVAHTAELRGTELDWVAVLHAGPGSALSGSAALRAAGLRASTTDDRAPELPWAERRTPQDLVDVAVPAGYPRVAASGTRLHRVTDLAQLLHPPARPARVRPAPAALHAAAWAATDRAAEWQLAAVVQQRLTTPRLLREALAGMPRLHRRALVRLVLDDVELGAHASSELDFLRLLRRNALPPPDRLQLPVRAGGMRYVDAWWSRRRVLIEIDGSHHREVRTWEADVLRANDLVISSRADPLILLRLTTGHLRHDEAEVVRQLRAVLL